MEYISKVILLKCINDSVNNYLLYTKKWTGIVHYGLENRLS